MDPLTVYNTYLRISSVKQNRPFTLRKDYDGLSQDKKDCITKIIYKLEQLDNINIDNFFTAPFELHGIEYVPLEYFVKYRAIQDYVRYLKVLENERADSERNIEATMKSLKHIFEYCRKNNFSNIEEYFNQKTQSNLQWIVDLKKRKIFVYALFLFPHIERVIHEEKDLIIYTLGDDFYDNINTFKMRFLTSRKTRQIIVNGRKKLNEVLETLKV